MTSDNPWRSSALFQRIDDTKRFMHKWSSADSSSAASSPRNSLRKSSALKTNCINRERPRAKEAYITEDMYEHSERLIKFASTDEVDECDDEVNDVVGHLEEPRGSADSGRSNLMRRRMTAAPVSMNDSHRLTRLQRRSPVNSSSSGRSGRSSDTCGSVSDIDDCILCDSMASERQYFLWKSPFTKSSFCARCAEDQECMRYVTYWGTPSYEAGSWKKRYNAGRKTDIDISPLIEVLDRIDNMNTKMGPYNYTNSTRVQETDAMENTQTFDASERESKYCNNIRTIMETNNNDSTTDSSRSARKQSRSELTNVSEITNAGTRNNNFDSLDNSDNIQASFYVGKVDNVYNDDLDDAVFEDDYSDISSADNGYLEFEEGLNESPDFKRRSTADSDLNIDIRIQHSRRAPKPFNLMENTVLNTKIPESSITEEQRTDPRNQCMAIPDKMNTGFDSINGEDDALTKRQRARRERITKLLERHTGDSIENNEAGQRDDVEDRIFVGVSNLKCDSVTSVGQTPTCNENNIQVSRPTQLKMTKDNSNECYCMPNRPCVWHELTEMVETEELSHKARDRKRRLSNIRSRMSKRISIGSIDLGSERTTPDIDNCLTKSDACEDRHKQNCEQTPDIELIKVTKTRDVTPRLSIPHSGASETEASVTSTNFRDVQRKIKEISEKGIDNVEMQHRQLEKHSSTCTDIGKGHFRSQYLTAAAATQEDSSPLVCRTRTLENHKRQFDSTSGFERTQVNEENVCSDNNIVTDDKADDEVEIKVSGIYAESDKDDVESESTSESDSKVTDETTSQEESSSEITSSSDISGKTTTSSKDGFSTIMEESTCSEGQDNRSSTSASFSNIDTTTPFRIPSRSISESKTSQDDDAADTKTTRAMSMDSSFRRSRRYRKVVLEEANQYAMDAVPCRTEKEDANLSPVSRYRKKYMRQKSEDGEKEELELDESNEEEQTLNWRTRGYSGDFYMTRESVTGGEIQDRYNKVLSNRRVRRRQKNRCSNSTQSYSSTFTDIMTTGSHATPRSVSCGLDRRPSQEDFKNALERADACSARTAQRLKRQLKNRDS